MPSMQSSVGVVAGQLNPTQFVDYEELANTTVGFAVTAVAICLISRLLLVPGVTQLVSARNRNDPTLQLAMGTYAHAIVISTLISGLFLVADPDFNVGDWMSWLGDEGIVGMADFRATRVQTVNSETVPVPDTELTTDALTRPHGRERCRLAERVDTAYADDAELALREPVKTAREDDRVLDGLEPTARIVEFAGSSVGLQTEFWVGSPVDANLADVRSQYRRHIERRLDREGLTFGPASSCEVSGHLDVDLVGGRSGE